MNDKMVYIRQVLPLRRGNPDDYLTNCPGPNHSNGDRRPSLHVSRGRAGGQAVVLRCFAGCTTEEVLAAAGLRWDDICEERAEPAAKPRNTKGWRRYYT